MVEIIQTDRDAAADCCSKSPHASERAIEGDIRAGRADDHRIVQGFAAYRSATQGRLVQQEGETSLQTLVASAKGHLANIRAHGNAEANACLVIERALDAALTPAQVEPVAFDKGAVVEAMARALRESDPERDDEWDYTDQAQAALDAALPLLGAEERGLPQDVIDLVIAARTVAYEDQSPEALCALDKASEAFAGRVRWDDEPEERGES